MPESNKIWHEFLKMETIRFRLSPWYFLQAAIFLGKGNSTCPRVSHSTLPFRLFCWAWRKQLFHPHWDRQVHISCCWGRPIRTNPCCPFPLGTVRICPSSGKWASSSRRTSRKLKCSLYLCSWPMTEASLWSRTLCIHGTWRRTEEAYMCLSSWFTWSHLLLSHKCFAKFFQPPNSKSRWY